MEFSKKQKVDRECRAYNDDWMPMLYKANWFRKLPCHASFTVANSIVNGRKQQAIQ